MKTFIIDTNVLLSDPEALFSFEENDVVIPMIVLEELDRHKDRQDEVGRNARESVRKLSGITQNLTTIDQPISLGEKKGSLKILSYTFLGYKDIKELIPAELEGKSGDNQILGVCLAFRKTHPSEIVVLVTRDILLRLKGSSLGITCEDYRKLHVAKSVTNLYTGLSTWEDNFDLTALYKDGGLTPHENRFHPNEFVILSDKDTGNTALTCFSKERNRLEPIKVTSQGKIDARNKEQKCAMHLLTNPNIPLVTVVGSAGTGKTLLAIAAGLEQVLNQKRYKSLIVCRPIQPVGKDIGYLPGTLEEKMEPWIAPIKDNLRFLISEGKKGKTNEQIVQYYFDQGIIEVEAMTFIRGRSIANAFMIIDEAQNLNAHELKTIITRVGEGTKIVLTGDIEQIDNMYVDSVSNGLTIAIEKFKGTDISGHITLTKGERSALATIAAQIL
jgi:PhoH-like ATPase